MADANIKRALAALMGRTRPTLAIYPATAAGGGQGAQITPAVGAWGAAADVIGAGAIAIEFWLRAVLLDTNTVVGAGLRAIQVFNLTTTTVVYELRVDPTAADVNIAPFNIPIPVYCAPGDRIQGRASGANVGDKIRMSLLVATGL